MQRDESPGALRILDFDRLLVGEQWQRDVRIGVDDQGRIQSVCPGRAGTGSERFKGWTVPGVPNVHSHAFQRALAGLAEGRKSASFWSWREAMYRFLHHLGPDDVEGIAAQLYVEMLKTGFTCVGEFHYLHHPPGGGAYDNVAEMSRRILEAAKTTGIGLVHMPVVYETGGFGGKSLEGSQHRFRMDLEGVVRLREVLETDLRPHRLGWAIHSLRAVSESSFRNVAAFLEGTRGAPVHIHVAEQQREVRECLATLGARPVEWLLDNAGVDAHWCLVHATHITQAEATAIARRGAIAGLCPTTEANLADGLFPLATFTARGGGFGVGTDSHLSRSPVEELRLLDYGQRLTSGNRTVLTEKGGRGNSETHLAENADPPASGGGDALSGAGGALLKHAWHAGCRALMWNGGDVAVGKRADLVVLDSEHSTLVGRDGPAVLDSWIFSGSENPVRDVLVGGHPVVRSGRHPREEDIGRNFAKVAKALARRI